MQFIINANSNAMKTNPHNNNADKKQEDASIPSTNGVIPPMTKTEEEEIETTKPNKSQYTTTNLEEPFKPRYRTRFIQCFRKANPVEWLMLAITFVLTVFNAWITYYAASQAGSAENAVKIAGESNILVRKSYETQNRAWIAIDVQFIGLSQNTPINLIDKNGTEGIGGTDDRVYHSEAVVKYKITNSGNTPAIQEKEIIISDTVEIPESKFVSIHQDSLNGVIAIAPNSTKDGSYNFNINKTPYYIAVIVGYRTFYDSLCWSEIYRYYTGDNNFIPMPTHNDIK